MKLTVVPVGALQTNCYLLSSELGNAILFDCGDEANRIMRAVEAERVTPKYIFITHGHHDHIGAVEALRSRYNIPVVISQGESACLRNKTNLKIVAEGDVITLDELRLKVLSTPGHTADGLTYLCQNLMFSGDTLFYEDCGRCDLAGGDYGVMQRSLKKLADLPGDYTVLPGHGQSSTLEHERACNPYFEWKKK